jgi:hypothetical protein
MSDQLDKRQSDVKELQADLNAKRLSRRSFLDRLKGIGVGFGAAAALVGTEAHASAGRDGEVVLKSTNGALENIVKDAPETHATGEEKPIQVAYYRRFYRRGYARFFYRRGYSRFYRRFYRRF